jgi:hypothetical protein
VFFDEGVGQPVNEWAYVTTTGTASDQRRWSVVPMHVVERKSLVEVHPTLELNTGHAVLQLGNRSTAERQR